MAPQLELLTAATPNGQKISITLEELCLPYTVTPISLGASEQKTPSFLALNPNGRIPVLIDRTRDAAGHAVFETSAIQLYLVTHYDAAHKLSFAADDAAEAAAASEMLQWLFWSHGGLGPMQGQANHFARYAPVAIEYARDRYANETRRLYGVLEARLREGGGREFLVGAKGGRFSVADISAFAWVRWAPWARVDLGDFPGVREWCERIEGREAVQRGLRVPDGDDQIERLRRDPEAGDPFQEWVMKGQNELKDQYQK
jgi:glutathione S-transferase